MLRSPDYSPSPASSPTSPERSRAVSLATSFGSWGPIKSRSSLPLCRTDRRIPEKQCLEHEGQGRSGPQSSSLFLILSVFLIFGGILFALDDAHQVGAHAIFTEHLEDVQQVRGLEQLTAAALVHTPHVEIGVLVAT